MNLVLLRLNQEWELQEHSQGYQDRHSGHCLDQEIANLRLIARCLNLILLLRKNNCASKNILDVRLEMIFFDEFTVNFTWKRTLWNVNRMMNSSSSISIVADTC